MKIGIVVDGREESQALKNLTQRLSRPDRQILSPRYADMQPKASPAQIVRAAIKQVRELINEDVERIFVLMDREDNEKCATEIKDEIERTFEKFDYKQVKVVIKNRKFENWLIADLEALKKMPKRFNLTKSFRTSVEPNKADNVNDAEALLNTIAVKTNYHKRKDAAAITQHQNELRIALNSRSFRRLLRLLNHPHYSDQSKRPNKSSN